MISEELLKILVCPEDKTPVQVAEPEVVAKINEAIAGGRVKNQGGEVLDTPIDAGLIRADGTRLYVIREDIPVMLIDEAIPLDQLG